MIAKNTTAADLILEGTVIQRTNQRKASDSSPDEYYDAIVRVDLYYKGEGPQFVTISGSK